MKFLRQGLSLALLGAGLAAVPAIQATTASAAPSADRSIVQRMKSEAQGPVRISTEGATGRVGFARTVSGDLLPSVGARSAGSAAAKADAYLDEYAAAFGARPSELERSAVRKTVGGWTVEYTQSYRGIPVFAGELRAHVDSDGDLTAVNGFAAPGLDLDVTPRISKADAAARATRLVRTAPSGAEDGDVDVSGLKVASNDLMVYRMGTTRGVEGESLLAWVLEVTNEHTVREMVILDARTGKPVNRWSMLAHALDRELYEGSLEPGSLVWSEGDAFPGGLDHDQQSEVQGAGETYWMFMNTFGYDSYDGAGAKMITVNNDPTISCPNANWNGVSTNYCTGVTADDTVAHEWGHAYTEHTSGLIYQWQSGAMNEAYSDIWGETVDMLNGRQDETPDGPREEGLCSQYTRGAVGLTINAPADIAGPCEAAPASFGPVFDKTGITGDLVVGKDAASGSDTDTNGCSPFTNAASLAGKLVYVDRGACTFAQKAQNVEAAGGTAIVIGQNNPDQAPFSASGDADIYGVMIGYADGQKIKAATETVNVTIKDIDEADKSNSYRWLSGEADPAFGGAIRDMWNPTCYGDPGKVSDAEYHCDTSDSGGVHSNSGVVNHAFALLVDGSTYNGVTVPAIGLDKAAHIFWRTQTEYLTPTSDFVDLADGLAASCADLVGQPINELTLGDSATGGSQAVPAAADPITAADCTAVGKAAEAVELATEPVQCNFGPLLAKDTPSLCGEGFASATTWSEDFEDGLAGWSQDEQLVFAGTSGFPWEADSSAPDGRAGSVAYAPDPTSGSCQGDASDDSSRNGLISPAVTYPTGAAPKLTFDHYVSTEVGWDGGNVKVSVNGGDYTLIPASAYLFNAPGADLIPANEFNTNPMAGQVAFTGTDGGKVEGSWGTSIVDLGAIAGAAPGDELRFRFDFGRDGCNGVDGWYVDNVQVTICKTATTVVATHNPEPATIGQPHSLAVEVTGGDPIDGEVTVTEDGEPVATGTLTDGTATIPLPTDMPAGVHELLVSYAGDETRAAGSDTVTVTIEKAASAIKAKPLKKKVKVGKKAKVKVTVTGAIAPTGTVTITHQGQEVGSRTLNSAGKAIVTITKRFAKGTRTFVATYGGSSSLAPSSDTFTVKFVQKKKGKKGS